MEPRSKSLAVTSSELEGVKSISDNIIRIDFASCLRGDGTAQDSQERAVKPLCTYLLRRTGLDAQSLLPSTESLSTSYTIATKTAKKLSRKSRTREIVRHSRGCDTCIAELWHVGSEYIGVKIKDPKDEGVSGFFDVIKTALGQYYFHVGGAKYVWEQLGPSSAVMQLSNQTRKRMALFVYSDTRTWRSGSFPGGLTGFQAQDVGSIQVLDVGEMGSKMLEKTLFTLVAIVDGT
ncbi:hypothetical protein ACLMJK_005684 [Lecanora helva]